MPDEKKTEEAKSSGMMTKIIASVFGAIVAPVVVTVGVRYLTSEPTKKDPDPKPPVVQPLLAFNGNNLDGFYSYGVENGTKDPKNVYTVKDGILRISGEELGYLASSKSCPQPYKLVVEYKWGEKTWPPREKEARSSGITIHNDGPDKLIDGHHAFGYECFLGEGGATGDLVIPKSAPVQLKLAVDVFSKDAANPKPPFVFLPNGVRTTVGPATVFQMNHDPKRTDVKGVVGKSDLEKPIGEWNELVINCGHNEKLGHTFSITLNGTRVNAGVQALRGGGKILFHSRGAEIFYKKIEVTPLTPPPTPTTPTTPTKK
jgi:Domain of Unknown Function (DUF1080)